MSQNTATWSRTFSNTYKLSRQLRATCVRHARQFFASRASGNPAGRNGSGSLAIFAAIDGFAFVPRGDLRSAVLACRPSFDAKTKRSHSCRR